MPKRSKYCKYSVLKDTLKSLQQEITTLKSLRNGEKDNHVLGKRNKEIDAKSSEFRLHHIAYCELNGTKRARIEKASISNQVKDKKIEAIKTKYQKLQKLQKTEKTTENNMSCAIG